MQIDNISTQLLRSGSIATICNNLKQLVILNLQQFIILQCLLVPAGSGMTGSSPHVPDMAGLSLM